MIIDLFLPLSLIFIMFTLGIGLTYKDFTNLLYNPKAFFIGVVNQMVILPIVAFIIILSIGDFSILSIAGFDKTPCVI